MRTHWERKVGKDLGHAGYALCQRSKLSKNCYHNCRDMVLTTVQCCAGTTHPLPTEPVTFPALCLAGRLPDQQNATVNLDLTHAQVDANHLQMQCNNLAALPSALAVLMCHAQESLHTWQAKTVMPWHAACTWRWGISRCNSLAGISQWRGNR